MLLVNLSPTHAQPTPHAAPAFTLGDWVAAGGCWDFSERIISAQGIGERPIAYLKRFHFTDFEFEIRLRLLTDEDGSYGVLFRYDEKKDAGYIFSVWPNGSYEFVRFNGDSSCQTGGGQAVYLMDQLHSWNRIKVIGRGNKFDLFINDNLLVTMQDNAFISGKVGLYLGHGATSFMEYEVLKLVAQ
ncbi:MAG: family 16 glycoside hydrolase [Candidatus Zhuqueibacterota bacterium]